MQNSQKILEALLHSTEIRVRGQESPPPSEMVMATCFQQLSNSYDEEYGGFSTSPKFPTPGQSLVLSPAVEQAALWGRAHPTASHFLPVFQ